MKFPSSLPAGVRSGVGNHGRRAEGYVGNYSALQEPRLPSSSLLFRVNSRQTSDLYYKHAPSFCTNGACSRRIGSCETEGSRKFCRRLLERKWSLSSCRFHARRIFVPKSACVGLVSECRNKRNCWGGWRKLWRG